QRASYLRGRQAVERPGEHIALREYPLHLLRRIVGECLLEKSELADRRVDVTRSMQAEIQKRQEADERSRENGVADSKGPLRPYNHRRTESLYGRYSAGKRASR